MVDGRKRKSTIASYFVPQTNDKPALEDDGERLGWPTLIIILSILAAIVLTSLVSYLLFHALVETIISVIAFSIFVIAWSSRRYMDNNYLMLIGVAYLFISLLGLLHMLAYKGMGIFPGADTNLPTQLWIATRYIEGASFLLAALLMLRRFYLPAVFAVYAMVTLAALAAIFSGLFPVAFIEGSGLTPFKVGSEYLISGLVAISILLLYRRRSLFPVEVFSLIVGAGFLTIAAELMFTLYNDPYGLLNLMGHITILVSFLFLFIALVRTGVERPYALIFRSLKKSEDSLRIERDFAEGIINNAQALVLVVGPDGRILRVNPFMEEVSGWREEELSSKIWTTAITPPDGSPAGSRALNDLLGGTGKAAFIGHLRAKSGQVRVIDWRLKALEGSTGQIPAILLIGHDMTEEVRLANELKKRAEELKQSNDELQQFAYVASHDLQEPLRMVIGYMSLLERKYRDQLDPKAGEYIDFALDGGTRMQELIKDLLDYSRVGSLGKEFEPVDLNLVVAETLALLKASIRENGAEIVVAPMPTVMADRTQMVQVFQNLLSNAIKFRKDRSPRVEISATASEGEWTIEVKDNGIGLEENQADRIFQMFQRLHTRDEYPGTGIGLAICKKIVERHGGRMGVRSKQGEGSTFFFTLPIASYSRPDKAAP